MSSKQNDVMALYLRCLLYTSNNESLILLMDKAAKLKPADVANLIRIADAFEKERCV